MGLLVLTTNWTPLTSYIEPYLTTVFLTETLCRNLGQLEVSVRTRKMQMGLLTNPTSSLTQQFSSHCNSLLSAWVILEPEETGQDSWGRHTRMKIILISPLISPPIWNFKESWAGWWYFRLGGCHWWIALQEHDPQFFWFACTNQLDSLSDK